MQSPDLQNTRWLRVGKLALGCGGVFVALLTAEVGVRARQYVRYGTFLAIGGSRQFDPATGLVIPEAGSNTATIRINTLGFRGPEIAQPKPPGTIRLAFVGASTTYCAEVGSNEKAWPHLVWARLRARYPEARFDYVNAGLPGAVVASSRVNFARRVKPLEPDVVVLYEGFNDVIVDSRRLSADRGIQVSSKEGAGLGRVSLLWMLVRKNVRVLLASAAARSGEERVLLPDSMPDRFAGELRSLIAEADQVASVVAVATLSSRLRRGQTFDEQLAAAEAALYYMPYLSPSSIRASYEMYNAAIRTEARRGGAVLVEGEDSIPPHAMYFRDTIHLADAGSERMADRVIDALSRAPAFEQLVAGRRAARLNGYGRQPRHLEQFRWPIGEPHGT